MVSTILVKLDHFPQVGAKTKKAQNKQDSILCLSWGIEQNFIRHVAALKCKWKPQIVKINPQKTTTSQWQYAWTTTFKQETKWKHYNVSTYFKRCICWNPFLIALDLDFHILCRNKKLYIHYISNLKLYIHIEKRIYMHTVYIVCTLYYYLKTMW